MPKWDRKFCLVGASQIELAVSGTTSLRVILDNTTGSLDASDLAP